MNVPSGKNWLALWETIKKDKPAWVAVLISVAALGYAIAMAMGLVTPSQTSPSPYPPPQYLDENAPLPEPTEETPAKGSSSSSASSRIAQKRSSSLWASTSHSSVTSWVAHPFPSLSSGTPAISAPRKSHKTSPWFQGNCGRSWGWGRRGSSCTGFLREEIPL